MSYEWDNCLRTELRTTFLLQINCKSYDLKIRNILIPIKFNAYLFSIIVYSIKVLYNLYKSYYIVVWLKFLSSTAAFTLFLNSSPGRNAGM